MRKTFGGTPGFTCMCYFHVKQACREYIMKNAKVPNEEKKSIRSKLSADIDYLRAAFTGDDFQMRCAAALEKWEGEEWLQKTFWKDKKGGQHTFASYFKKEWVDEVNDWYRRHVVQPTTNNAAESAIKQLRCDAGQVVGGIGKTLAFILEQMERYSYNDWNPENVPIIASRTSLQQQGLKRSNDNNKG